jgi:hypothetical protein
MSTSTPQNAPLRSRIWATVTGSNYRVKKYKQFGEDIKREVDSNKAYIAIDAYTAFGKDYDAQVASVSPSVA